jgi:uncharacterized peroxidase-related enzyme
MNPFKLHTPETVNETTAADLNSVVDQLGFLPNIFAVSAGAPPALAGFIALNQQFAKTSLSEMEREIVHTATSVENEAPYCVAGHTAFADMLELDEVAIQAVRTQDAVNDDKLEALRTFTRLVVDQKGDLTEDQLSAFLAAGYNADQVLEVILGITVKVFTNFTSKMTGISLDQPFSPYAWSAADDIKENKFHVV